MNLELFIFVFIVVFIVGLVWLLCRWDENLRDWRWKKFDEEMSSMFWKSESESDDLQKLEIRREFLKDWDKRSPPELTWVLSRMALEQIDEEITKKKR